MSGKKSCLRNRPSANGLFMKLVFRENGKIKYVPEHFTLKDLSQFLLACGKLPGSKDIKTFRYNDKTNCLILFGYRTLATSRRVIDKKQL